MRGRHGSICFVLVIYRTRVGHMPELKKDRETGVTLYRPSSVVFLFLLLYFIFFLCSSQPVCDPKRKEKQHVSNLMQRAVFGVVFFTVLHRSKKSDMKFAGRKRANAAPVTLSTLHLNDSRRKSGSSGLQIKKSFTCCDT